MSRDNRRNVWQAPEKVRLKNSGGRQGQSLGGGSLHKGDGERVWLLRWKSQEKKQTES